MKWQIYYLGIDVGSVTVSMVLMDESNRIIQTDYTFHKGQIVECLSDLLKDIDLSQIKTIGYTSSTPKILKLGKVTDSRVAAISAANPQSDTLPVPPNRSPSCASIFLVIS